MKRWAIAAITSCILASGCPCSSGASPDIGGDPYPEGILLRDPVPRLDTFAGKAISDNNRPILPRTFVQGFKVVHENKVDDKEKLTKQITQRALRRTFNDLARAANVSDLVTRSISGHLTEQMQRHYSTVNGTEQRSALAKVIALANRPANKSGEVGGEGAPKSGEDQKTA